MKLRFEVDQAECFRKGIDCPKSIVTIEVDPAKLSQEERNLIADRLDGISVCQMSRVDPTIGYSSPGRPMKRWRTGTLIKADEPTYEALILAVRLDEAADTPIGQL